MEIKFSKIHGLGNDFIVIGELQREQVSERDKPFFAKRNCQHEIGVGADGVLFLCKPKGKDADFRMRIFNSDGSEAENCVNGLRCVAFEKFLLEGGKKKEFLIETAKGTVEAKICAVKGNTAEVQLRVLGKKEVLGKFPIVVEGKGFEYFKVDVGNPHAVVFLKDDVHGFPVEKIGHAFEWHAAFKPERTNTEFVNILSPTKVRMRVHERGVCETAACGSGSIAAVLAGIEAGVLEPEKWVGVEQPGGVLQVKAGADLFLMGPAQKVFEGTLEW
ncbi:MAG: diaminopimelate epimerase [Candidatus Diapherotrites archaeon]|nr:diaminopimelate epimerase [Candidatus Diapherotrites archaeon]